MVAENKIKHKPAAFPRRFAICLNSFDCDFALQYNPAVIAVITNTSAAMSGFQSNMDTTSSLYARLAYMNRLRGSIIMERNVLMAVIDTLKAKSALNREANLNDEEKTRMRECETEYNSHKVYGTALATD